MDKEVVISVRTIAITLLGFLAIYIVYRLGPVFGILFVSWLLVVALEPVVKFFMRIVFMNKPLHRVAAVLLTYFIFIAVLVLVFTLGLPPILSQASKLILAINTFLKGSMSIGGTEISFSDFLPNLGDLSKYALSFTYVVLSNLASIITILFLSLYMSFDWENLKDKFVDLFSGRLKKKVEEIVDDIELDIGHWVKGQLMLMVAVGVMSFVGLVIVRVDYPLALGLISGILEIIPVFGPVITAILASLLGFTVSPVKGFVTLGVFVIVQQLENNFLVPRIMHKVSGFSPLLVLVSVIVGTHFFGFGGAVLAVPITMIGWIMLRRILEYTAGN